MYEFCGEHKKKSRTRQMSIECVGDAENLFNMSSIMQRYFDSNNIGGLIARNMIGITMLEIICGHSARYHHAQVC